MKKNCKTCKHLEYIDDGGCEYGIGLGGFCCNKRKYRSDYEEDFHNGQLEYDSYLEKGKSCHEPRINK